MPRTSARAHRTTISSTVPLPRRCCWYAAGGCRAGCCRLPGTLSVAVGVLRYTSSLWYYHGFQLPGRRRAALPSCQGLRVSRRPGPRPHQGRHQLPGWPARVQRTPLPRRSRGRRPGRAGAARTEPAAAPVRAADEVMMSRTRRPGQCRDSATSSRREDIPAPATDHPGPGIWTWLETVSLPEVSGGPPGSW
jgi:hypothetical protein